MAYLHDNAAFGGIETLQLQILRHLDPVRYRAVVVVEKSDSMSSTRFRDQLHAVDVPLLTPGRPDAPRRGRRVGDVFDVARLLRRHRIDVAHIQTRTPASSRWLTVGAFLAGTPAIIRTEHVSPGPHVDDHTRTTVKPFDWMTDLLFTDSQADRREQIEIVGRAPDKVVTSYCGIDPLQFDPHHDVASAKRALGLDPAVPVVGTVGRLHEQKGGRYLVEAAAIVAGRRPSVTFLIVGDGPLEAELRGMAASAGIADRIIFAGYQDDAVPYMQAMDVVAMPSLWEGFSISMQEFMALAKPMVVSDHHSFSEAMVDGEHGVIVPRRDSAALAEAIIGLLDDDERRERIGRAAATRAREEFSIRRHVDELMAAYDAVLGDRPEGRPSRP